jgi:hypothetical protein
MAALLASSAALAGCFREVKEEPTRPEPPPIPVRGTIADMKTEDGVVDGYRVSRTCKKPSCIGLQAERGTRAFVPGTRSEFEELRSAVHRSCKDVASLFSSGAGAGCVDAGPPALLVWMYDWREVDVLIACAGRVLIEAHSNDPVFICVQDRNFPVED